MLLEADQLVSEPHTGFGDEQSVVEETLGLPSAEMRWP